jgi:K+-sensing histidine kinase KdpD
MTANYLYNNATFVPKQNIKAGNPTAASMLAKMDKQINKLTGLISDLLDASKVNSGQLNYQSSTSIIHK